MRTIPVSSLQSHALKKLITTNTNPMACLTWLSVPLLQTIIHLPTALAFTTMESSFILCDGKRMEVLYSLPSVQQHTNKPALIFLHGSFHSAWCWKENFFPYFSSRGYPCVALSLRGTEGTFAGDGVKKVQIGQQLEDVLYFLECLRGDDEGCSKQSELAPFFDYVSEVSEECTSIHIPPVLIAHSFAGLSAMKLLENEKMHLHFVPTEQSAKTVKASNIKEKSLLSSMALLNSVPPSGIKKMSLRKSTLNYPV